MSFKISLRDPIKKIGEYLTVLKSVNYQGLKVEHLAEKAPCGDKILSCFFSCRYSQSLSNNFRAVLYCGMVHPVHFLKYGSVESWYETRAICRQLKNGESLYKPEGLQILAQDIKNQLPFIEKIQQSKIDLSKPFPDSCLEEFEQYMTLVKKHDGVHKLSPSLAVDIVWHAYMLDPAYIKDTKEYFGRVLDHDDSPKPEEVLIEQRALTARLKEKDSLSTTDALFMAWFLNQAVPHTVALPSKSTSSSCSSGIFGDTSSKSSCSSSCDDTDTSSSSDSSSSSCSSSSCSSCGD